jgi:hypothetical protein
MKKHTHRLILSDRTSVALTISQAIDFDIAMSEHSAFFRLNKDTVYNIPRDIIRCEPIKPTQADVPRPDRTLAPGLAGD